ncbi:MAG: hypothetical protein ABSE82_14410, partial [Nitrososphaerales archaeon]
MYAKRFTFSPVAASLSDQPHAASRKFGLSGAVSFRPCGGIAWAVLAYGRLAKAIFASLSVQRTLPCICQPSN